MHETKDTEAAPSILDRQDGDVFSAGAGTVIHEQIQTSDVEVIEAKEGLLGSLVKAAYDIIKVMPKHWGFMNEEERDMLLDCLRHDFAPLIQHAARLIASKGRRIITGSIDKMTTKDTIQVTINAPRSPEACAAFGMAAGGGQVAFLLLDTESLLGDRSDIPISDQLTMDLDETGDAATKDGTSSTICPL
ncbi:MAG: hypothetical protein HQL73_03615 [Magnetococcales bacterium]|nr:hypothetical protein [Magnetococcales bacterium]